MDVRLNSRGPQAIAPRPFAFSVGKMDTSGAEILSSPSFTTANILKLTLLKDWFILLSKFSPLLFLLQVHL